MKIIDIKGYKYNRKLYKQINKLEYPIQKQLWIERFKALYDSNDSRKNQLLDEFVNIEFEILSENKNKHFDSRPILFCVIKNDFEKLPRFLEYYRRLQVDSFVFWDNNSTDGTKEFLLQQEDVTLIECEQMYSSVRRVAWLNTMIGLYGEKKWCLVVDSDEFVDFIESKQQTFEDIIRICEANNIKRLEGFLLDMYSGGAMFDSSEDDWYINNCYFDNNSYKLINQPNGLVIKGGPRNRRIKVDVQLSKYPLFYFTDKDILASSHYMIPYISTRKIPVVFAIRHYKFLNEKDFEKIKKAIVDGNYANNSSDYKAYYNAIRGESNFSFYSKRRSTRYIDSDSLKQISFLKNLFE